MVKNTKGGKHHKKQKKRREVADGGKIVYADATQVYASVTKKVGGSRIWVSCSDTKDRSALIPGKFFKKVWMNEGDILLCALNPNDDTQCYIIHKYSYKDANLLKSQGKITFTLIEGSDDEDGYDFTDPNGEGMDQEEGPNKILDINNVTNANSNVSEDDDSKEKEEEEDIISDNQNRNNTLQSTKWTSNKNKEKEKDTKVYTIDDL